MAEIGRILTSLGAVMASVGLVVYGMGRAYVRSGDFEVTLGIWMMVGGVIATAVGLVLYHQASTEPDTDTDITAGSG